MSNIDDTILGDDEYPGDMTLSPNADLGFLKSKLTEYIERLKNLQSENQYSHPGHPVFADTLYKTALVWVLITVPGVSINTWDWSLRLAKHNLLHVDEFQNACGVIGDYIATGGKNTFRF